MNLLNDLLFDGYFMELAACAYHIETSIEVADIEGASVFSWEGLVCSYASSCDVEQFYKDGAVSDVNIQL